MIHSFDTDHAVQHGLPEAVLISNMQFWIAKNKANGKHFYDGRTWTYNSVKAFSELFPYMNPRQVRHALDKLVLRGVLLKGNYNQSTTDRTLWYAFNDECNFLSCQMHLTNMANGNAKKGKSTNKTDRKPDGKQQIAALAALGVSEQTASDWLSIRKAKRLPLTQTALDGVVAEAEKAGLSLEDVLKTCCNRGWASFEAKWLQNERRQQNLGHNPERRQSDLDALNRANNEAAKRLLFGNDDSEVIDV